MNLSVTVSGENPTSVSLVEELNNNIFISGNASFEAKKTDIKNILVIVGEKDNINVHSQNTIYVTGDVVRPSEIAPIQTAISDLDSRVASNDSDIGALQTATGDLDSRVASNDSDIGALQTATGDLDSRVASNDSDIGALQTATGDLDSRVASNDSDIGALQTATGDLDSRVASNDSDIGALQTATGDLDSRVASNDSDIGALQTATGDLDSRGASNTSGVNTLTGNFSKTQLNLKYKEYQQTYFKDFIEISGDLSKIEIYESSSKNTKFFTQNFFYNFSGDLTGVLITDHLDNKTLTKNYVYNISGDLVNILENYS